MRDRTSGNGVFAAPRLDWASARGSGSTVAEDSGGGEGLGEKSQRLVAQGNRSRNPNQPLGVNDMGTVAWDVAFWATLGSAAIVRILGY